MWGQAFFEQAKSDWEAYEYLRKRAGSFDCHTLHYLQMATEKIAKAGQLKGGANQQKLTTSHKGFTNYLRQIGKNVILAKMLGVRPTQLYYMVNNQLLPIAHEIEQLAPALSKGRPNAEYPWEAPGGVVLIPVTFVFPLFDLLSNDSGRNFLRVMKIIVMKFDEIS